MKNLKNQKFAQFLSILTGSERKKFKKHLKNSYPASQQLHDLLDWFLQNTPQSAYENYSLQDLHQLLFPEEPLDTKKVSNLLSRLYLELRSFAIHLNLAHYPGLESIMLLDYLRKKDAIGLFSKEYRNLQSSYNDNAKLGNWDALLKMTGHYTRFYYPATSTSDNEDLIEAWTNLQIHAEILNLKFSIAALNRQAILGSQDLNLILRSSIVPSPIEEDDIFYPIVQCLRLLHQLYITPTVAIYQASKNHYFKYFESLPYVDRNQALRYLLNIAIDQYKKGELVFFQEVYEMYKFGVRSRALFFSNDLSSNAFINIIDVASLAKDYEFAQSFYDRYLSATNPIEQPSNRLLGQAFLTYSAKDYSGAAQLLQQIQPENIFIKIKTSELKTRISFEAGELDAVFDGVEKFRGMLSRAKDQGSEQLFLPYQNYLKLLSELAKIPQISKEVLLKKYQNNQPMSNNIWLYEHIQQRK